MHILLVPDKNVNRTTSCLPRRRVLILAFLLLVLLPAGIGFGAYQITSTLTRAAAPHLDPVYVTKLQQTLAAQRDEIDTARQQAETHLNALAAHMGRIQAQVLRINALGQRLTEMAQLDKGEFNFDAEPAIGGPEPRSALAGAQKSELLTALDELALQADTKHQELTLLEAMIMDRQLQDSLDPKGWPVVGGYISSNFGYRRDPFNGRRAFHQGVDIATKPGRPVKALASGVVTHAGEESGYGRMVEINHGNGNTTRYAHTLAILVEIGDKVEKGEEIALVGNSGRSTGPHLHFEFLRNGRPINPRRFLRASR